MSLNLKEKRVALQKHIADTKAFYKQLEDAGEAATQEDRNKLENMFEAGKVLRQEVENLQALQEADDFVNQPAYGPRAKAGAPRRQSWGQMVISSDQYKGLNPRAKTMMPVPVGGIKDLYGSTDAAGGAFVVPMRDPEYVGIAQQPRSVLDLITIAETASDAVEFVRQTTRTNSAAPKLEYNSGFVSAAESNMVFELVSAPVKTIATYVEASRQVLSDAPQMRSIVDDELSYDLRVKLEDQIVNGSGSGANFTGILNTTNVQTRTQADTGDRGGETTDTKADALRRAITDIRLAFYEANGVLLNPGDGEDVELLKDSNGNFLKIYDPVANRLWRVPVIESSVIAAGTGLVGNFRMGATLYDRQMTDIRVGEPGSTFLQSAVAILAELRAALAVKRPTAFEVVTFA